MTVDARQSADTVKISRFSGKPLPRFESLRYSAVHGRQGPNLDHQILWRYELKRGPEDAARSKARLKPGVIAELVACEGGWCEVKIARNSGYLPESVLWGTEIETGKL